MSAALIFDCDGVLVDSEPIACAATAECLQRLGLDITTAEILERYIGLSSSAMYSDLESRHRLAIGTPQRDRILALVEARLHESVKAMPGIAEVLEQLRLHHRMCVASSSSHSRIATSLSRAKLLHNFEGQVFSASEVANGKPAPDLFLYAAARMGVRPAGCLVIEDSTAGVRAAIAAGMRCVGFAGGGHANARLSESLLACGAFCVIDSMTELASVLQSPAHGHQ